MPVEEAIHVKAKQIPRPEPGDQVNEAYYRLCYHYPQYTLEEAMTLPFHWVLAHLAVARREKANEYLELLNISSAPHTKKGQGVKKLANQYKRVAEGADG